MSADGSAVDEELFNAAKALIRHRFGDSPWSGAAVVRLEDGSILTSTAPDALNDAVSLCHETGAYCEAFKLDKRITISLCLVQPEPGSFLVLTPCGVCQERLFLYGPDTMVGVPAPAGWALARLADVQPHHWRNALPESG